jgi:hypothetical protein
LAATRKQAQNRQDDYNRFTIAHSRRSRLLAAPGDS